mmetsp:Transcript_83005/g.213879  ORF Transcript_83005/g.213879 Transcript_83005/m.213879 type:complete len:248 (+) Transcript_83005:279-1022(+)
MAEVVLHSHLPGHTAVMLLLVVDEQPTIVRDQRCKRLGHPKIAASCIVGAHEEANRQRHARPAGGGVRALLRHRLSAGSRRGRGQGELVVVHTHPQDDGQLGLPVADTQRLLEGEDHSISGVDRGICSAVRARQVRVGAFIAPPDADVPVLPRVVPAPIRLHVTPVAGNRRQHLVVQLVPATDLDARDQDHRSRHTREADRNEGGAHDKREGVLDDCAIDRKRIAEQDRGGDERDGQQRCRQCNIVE